MLPEAPSSNQFFTVWVEGGWVMVPLFLLALFIYFQATGLLSYLKRSKVGGVSEAMLQSWVADPAKGTGHAGEVIRYVLAQGYHAKSILGRLEEVRQQLIPEVNQRIVLLSVVVTVSPLMGLLGTVIGMLTTFKGLSASTGKTVDLVAQGISEALITTQTGLMIAIPGYLFLAAVIRRRNEYTGFLAQLESSALQYGAKLSKS